MQLSRSILRRLDQLGLRAVPARVRNPDDYRHRELMLVAVETGAVMAGGPFPFSLTDDEVRTIVNGQSLPRHSAR